MMKSSKRDHQESENIDSFEEDDLVISGISGRFPLADNLEELKENLYSKRNCIVRAEERWSSELKGFPNNYIGAVNNLDKFDAAFFNITVTNANSEDCQTRFLHELCYEAIIDSGYGPKELGGKHIGVFVGLSDPDPTVLARSDEFKVFGLKVAVGIMACMLSNKISHRYNFTGPSFSIDSACCSSACALEEAFRRLKDGTIEAAIIGGASLCMDPRVAKSYFDIGLLSNSGENRSYDAEASGFVNGEAAAAIFVQKKKDARRIYAKIHNIECRTADMQSEGSFVPSLKSQMQLYKKTYEGLGFDPSLVDYIEGNGASTRAADESELNSIDEVFCKNRKTPLLLGTVKSNIGNTKAPSMLASVAKVILAFETGSLAPNIHHEIPNPRIPSLQNGKIKVVTEAVPYDKPLAGINNFAFTGSITHMVLQRNEIGKSPKHEENNREIPKVVVYSATTSNALQSMFSHFHQNALSNEFYALLNKSAYGPVVLAPYRGFTILKNDGPPVTSIEQTPPVKRLVWYVVTGMGCQWPGMGLDLMKLKVFAESMQLSAKVLEPLGIDLLELLNPKKDYLLQDRHITPAFVTIVAIQIALVDLLNTLGLEPDGIIGHSTGEIVCSYIDGCCTAEQTILSAYYRGESVESTELPRGSMAAVGLTWEEAKKRCPEGVFPACHNAEDSVTISGSQEAVEKFVKELKSENIFARIVNAYGYAFHCKTIAAVTEKLRSSLQKVYVSPKLRTKRWLSTSYCEHEWDEPECQLADANYFCHNLESEVHFREVLTHIPADAITIEIGPHFLLQSVLKRAIGNKAAYIGLMKRNANNVDFFLSSVGKLYSLGLDTQVENLYEPVSYPVPRGTPMISPFIKWDHTDSYKVVKYVPRTAGNRRFASNTDSAESFLLDHCIDGRPLYPATGYLYLAWKALSQSLNKPMDQLPVCIENFRIARATILSSKDTKIFDVSILQYSGDFEIVEGDAVVATGKIHSPKSPMFEDSNNFINPRKTALRVSGSEMYNELKIHGYEYGPAFQGLLEINMEGTGGLVKWNEEWLSFLDSLLLFFGIIYENSNFRLPTGALSVKIDPRIHNKFISGMQDAGFTGVPVIYDRDNRKCTTPGVEIRNLQLDTAARRSISGIVPVVEAYNFVSYHEKFALDSEEKTKCELYCQACCSVARRIIQKLNINGKVQRAFSVIKVNDDMEYYKEFFSTMNENFSVLNSLQDILEFSVSPKLGSHIEARCQNISDILAQDMLFKAALTEKPLRSLLDVAAENCSGKMNITEYCDFGPVLIATVQETIKFSTQTKTSYTVVHTQATAVDAESLRREGTEVRCLSENDAIPSNLNCSSHIVVTSFVLGSTDNLRSCIHRAATLTKERGFIVVIHKHELTPPELVIHHLSKTSLTVQSEDEIEKYFFQQNLLIASKKSCSFGVNLYLIRKISQVTSPSNTHVVMVLEDDYNLWVEELKRAMEGLQEREGTGLALLVAQGSSTNGIIGMANCLKQEPGGDKIRCIFTDSSAPQFNLNEEFYADVLKKDLFMNVYMNGLWGSFRHSTLAENKTEELMDFAFVNCLKIGDLSSFQWLESPVKRTPLQQESDELYHVYYSSLNFKDVMIATGKLIASTFKESGVRTDSMILGMEFSGRDESGRRIMAMCGGGAICNTYLGTPVDVYDIPDHWSLEEAATVPVVYITCYFGLIYRGRLQNGEKILIHSGTGGIGQAAIRIALSMDCEVFTTVGNPEKKEFLMKTFPQLKPENIGSSRDTMFEEMVMRETQGEGVDVVLNSLADDKFLASVRCLGYNGRFLEIGKYDLQMNTPLGLQIFEKGISFYGIQLDTYFRKTESQLGLFKYLKELLYDGIRKGVVQPLKTTVFSKDDIENAFRFMGSGKHIGKVVIKVREEETEKLGVLAPLKVKAYRNLSLYSTKSYIIIGGLGGFGIELAKWLIQKGAGTLVLTSRFGARTSYHHLCLKRWKDAGAHVVVSTLNVVKRDEAKKLLEEVSTLYGPVGGIFNSAVVLKDAFIENQTASDFADVCAPKALATKYLDELSRLICPELDLFVCFSSISCGKGNAGQTNYGYANSVMERICEKRKSEGLHGLAIQWGIIGDVGLVHRHMGDDAMIAGVMAQKIKSCLQTLEKLLLQDKPVVSSFVTADKSRMKKKSDDVLSQMAKLFGFTDIEQMNPYRTFGEMGIDSMIGVEMKQLLESTFDATFTLQAIQEMKIEDVKRLNEEKGKTKDSEVTQSTDIKKINLNGTKVSLPEEAVIALNTAENGTPIFLIHSNDHLYSRLKKLSGRIAHRVFALQSTKDTPVNSLKEMSLWYLKQIKNIFPDKAVHLASVSAAGNLALEMMVQSQNQNGQRSDIKSLTILDGSLNLMETLTCTEHEKTKNLSAYEASDLCEFLSVFSDTDLSQLKTQLEQLPTLESRMDMISNIFTSSNKSEMRQAAEFFTRKQNLIRFCTPSGKYRKNITAIEAVEKVLPNDVSTLKSSLAEVCDGRITIHRLVGNNEFLVGESSAAEVASLLNKLCE